MTKESALISLVTLFLLLLSACSTAAPTSVSSTPGENGSTIQSANSAGTAKLNLNTASDDDFLTVIPGLGNRMVREFKEYRPYISIQQFRREIGKYVDEAQVSEYEQYVYVPIAINDSDSETLQQIHGLTTDEAASLISARPFASTDEFLTKLSEHISTDELEIAKTYLGDNS